MQRNKAKMNISQACHSKKMVIIHLTFANEIYIDVQTHMDSRIMCVNI